MGIYFFVKALPRFSSKKKFKTPVVLFLFGKHFLCGVFKKEEKLEPRAAVEVERACKRASERASFDGMRLSGDMCDDAEPEPGAKTNEGLGLGSRVL